MSQLESLKLSTPCHDPDDLAAKESISYEIIFQYLRSLRVLEMRRLSVRRLSVRRLLLTQHTPSLPTMLVASF